jgi:putative spermidine/putrescine transport system permease protein
VISFFGLGRVELLGTTTGVTIAMAQVMAPYMILPLYADMRTVDRRLVQAAKSLGAGPATAFFKVFLPLTSRGIMAGSLIVFVLSLGFYITPAIIGSPTNSLISQAIVDQTNRLLDWGHAGAMSLVLFVVTFLFIGLATLLGRKSFAKRGEESQA